MRDLKELIEIEKIVLRIELLKDEKKVREKDEERMMEIEKEIGIVEGKKKFKIWCKILEKISRI